MAQQGQPAVPFNALKPATWGSLKLIPQALRSKLVGGKASENVHGVAFGKENAANPHAALNPPPKIGDLSHLQSIGPRRNVNQRYVLQPNLNVSRPALQNHAPGLSGLLLPAAQHHHQQPQQYQQSLQQQQQSLQQQHAPQQQRQSRSSTPSSPTLRGRQPLPNPNFVPSPANIPTRLPTPVRINPASPGPSPSTNSNMPLTLPKPPSPSRSLSQSGALPANAGAYNSTCSSPAASTPTSSAFSLPMPPSILGNLSAIRTSNQQAPRSTQQAMPWAAASTREGQSYTTPTSVRPSPPAPERSILASVQLPSQQLRAPTPISGRAAAVPGVETAAAVAATPQLGDGPSVASISPVVNVPSIQAALQQALQAAMERKPETFKVDNFEQLFDSMMHPGTATKLDGPLPDELPDDVRYSDNWYKHCRDWNAQHKPSGPYTVAVTPTPETPVSGQVISTPFAAPPEQGRGQPAPLAQPQEQQQRQQPWALGEPPMSEACCKALEVAHHGLRKVLTPVSRSNSLSNLAHAQSNAGGQAATSYAPRSLLDQLERLHVTAKAAATTTEHALEDTATAASPAAVAGAVDASVAHTAAALASALEALARDQEADGVPALDRQQASVTALAPPIAVAEGVAQAQPTVGVVRPKVPKLRLVVDGHETPRAPTAADPMPDSARPMPDSARPTSTAATTPGPKTPGGAVDSVATTAATTPVGRVATSANTPTTARGANAASPSGLDIGEAALGDACACEQTGTTSGAAESAAEVPVLPPLRKISSELAAASQAIALSAQASSTLQEPQSVRAPSPSPSESGVLDPSVLWSPAFPPVARAASMVQGAVAAAAAAVVRPPSPVTLLQSAPREMPTPNPAFLHNVAAASAGPSALAAAVAAVAAPDKSVGVGPRDAAGPSTSMVAPPPDPLKEIVVGIEKLSTLKHNILAEDKEVDVASITQMIQLKLAVEQLLARTSTAAQAVVAAEPAPVAACATAAAAAPAAPPAAAPVPEQAVKASIEQNTASTPKKDSRSTGFGAFLKSVFSPRSGSASKAQAPVAAAPQAPSSAARAFGTNITSSLNAGAVAVVPASPASTAIGVKAPRPASVSALPRHAASPSLADRSRYAALHQKAAARLAEAAAEPAAARPAPAAAATTQNPRGDVWRRYEEKIAVHRQQLDNTKSQLDEALRKLNDMQVEFDELLLCLGMESAKNKALCDAMRAAGLDPEPILAAIEEQWMSGGFVE